ncbi:hypothetical protein ACHAPX_004191 [Trichoderma viride]
MARSDVDLSPGASDIGLVGVGDVIMLASLQFPSESLEDVAEDVAEGLAEGLTEDAAPFAGSGKRFGAVAMYWVFHLMKALFAF